MQFKANTAKDVAGDAIAATLCNAWVAAAWLPGHWAGLTGWQGFVVSSAVLTATVMGFKAWQKRRRK